MGKKYRNLIGRIVAPENMRSAYRSTVRAKHFRPGALSFKEYAEVNLAALAERMADGTYTPSPPHHFTLFEPKARQITALQFHDRVVQHALYAIVGPIFEKALLPRTYACRKNMGTHAGVVALQAEMRRELKPAPGYAGAPPLYFLKTDFSKFFPSIDRAALHRMIRKKITCRATLCLIEAIIPPAGIGLPIGSLTSQLFANVYAGAVDRHLQQDLGERCWYRYMDDIVLLGRSVERLRAVRDSIEQFSRDHLGLRFSKWSIAPVSHGINFLGYRIWPTHKLLRRQSVIRAKRKIAAYRAGGHTDRMQKFIGSWIGHARWADAHNLLRTLQLEDYL